MNQLPVPRPIEFMALGFSVGQMQQIVARWPEATEDDLRKMGFLPPEAEIFQFPAPK